MSRTRNSLLFLVMLLGICMMWAATINVPADYTTIQAAIDVANPGDVIDVAAGTYLTTSQINIYESITIQGQGAVTIQANNPSWVTDNSGKHFIGIYGGTETSPVTISNITMDGNGQSCGINAYNNAYGVLNSVTVTNSRNAALIVNGSTIIATNLNTSGNAWGAVNVDPGSGVTDPSVFTLVSGVLNENYQIWSDGANVTSEATVTVNTPDGYSRYFVGDTTVSYWTNRALENCATITSNDETRVYQTIQAAIDAADPGDVINVAAGNYDEHVIINKAISLLGPNANISAVDGTRVPEAVIGQYITVNNGAGLSDVIIAGFEFNETDASHSIIMIGGNTEDVQILNNRFINIPWKAIYTEAGANVTNLDMIISGNLISGVSGTSESGIYLINHTGGTISNNKIENTVYGGILINTYCHGMTISNNQIYNVPQQGLQLSGDVADVTVSGNIIDHANTAEVSDKGGIRLYASDFTGTVTISGNTISNSFNGIAVKNAVGDLTGIDINILNNNLANNSNAGVYIPSTYVGTMNAEYNWWGDTDPSDNVLGSVDFEPWWLDVSMTRASNDTVLNYTQNEWYSSIQAAIDAADPGDVIEVAAGTYDVTKIIIDKPLTLNGANANIAYGSPLRGPESLVRDLTRSNQPVFLAASDGVTINGFEISDPWGSSAVDAGLTGYNNWTVIYNYIHHVGSSRDSQNSYAVRYKVGSGNTSNITITDNYISYVGNTTTALGHSGGIWFGDSLSNGVVSNVLISRNTIKYIQSAVAAKGSWGITFGTGWGTGTGYMNAPVITDNVITDLAGGYTQAIDLEGPSPNAIVTGNVINNLTSLVPDGSCGLFIASSNNEASTLSIYNNKFSNMAYGVYNGYAMGVVNATRNYWGHASGPFNTTTNSDGQGSAVGDLVSYDPWYISSDMDETDSNAPVENITQNLFSYTIQSAIDTAVESNVIVINGGTYNENLVIDTPLTLMPSGRDPVVINGTGTGSVITVAADGVEITGLTIQGSGSELTDAGIYIMAHNNTNIHGNVIQNNASGILLADGTGNHFTANEIHDNALYGIGLVAAVANTIDDNNIYNIGYDGIALENLNKLTEVEGDKIFGSVLNTISENDVTAAQDGLFIGFNCDNNAITNNVFEATESAVHLWRGGNQTITGNTLTGAEIGLRLKASNDNTIQNNTITGNEVGLNTGGTLDYGPSEDNLIIQNRIYGNSVYGAQTLEGSPLDLTRNWWGDPAGPAAPVRYGNAVTTNVTYDPWWINEEMTILSTDVTLSLSTPEHLVKDLETQPFAVTLAQVEDLRGFNVQIKVPKIDYAIPTNFAIGPSFAAGDNTLFTFDSSDNDYWMIDVTGSYDGAASLDGPNLVLFTFDLTTLADASNLTGSQIELPLAQVLMYNEMNHYIPCAGTTGEIVIIDSGEPTMIQQPENAIAYPSGMLLTVDAGGSGLLVRPVFELTMTDDYDLSYAQYMIIAEDATAPDAINQFSLAMPAIDGTATTGYTWQLPETVDDLADGPWTVYFIVVDDAGNFSIYDWDFEIDTTLPATPLWTSCLTTVDGANSVDLIWTGDAAKYDIWVLNYDDLTYAGGYPLYNPAAFGTPAIPAAPNAYNPAVQNGWTRIENDLVGTTYTHIPAVRGYYYYYIFAEDLAGNYSPVSEMRESISYWPGDVNATPDGFVTADDITLLGSVWGLTNASGSFVDTYDVGPSIGRLRRGRPTPDGRINIEDLMMFSMNYMNTNYTAYPRSTNDSKPDPVRIDIEQEILGNELIVRLILSENNGLVKGLNIPLEIGSGLELQSVTAGTIWNEESILLHTNEQGKVELSGSNLVDCIAENGLVATLSFKISGQNTELALKHMIARAFDNSDIEIIDNPQDAPSGDDDPEIIIPATSFLGANYPNPFNPTTTIGFGLNESGNVKISVFNSRGQLVRTLVNGSMQAGMHNVVWNGMDDTNRPLGSGIYFIKMQTRNLEQTTRAIMVK